MYYNISTVCFRALRRPYGCILMRLFLRLNVNSFGRDKNEITAGLCRSKSLRHGFIRILSLCLTFFVTTGPSDEPNPTFIIELLNAHFSRTPPRLTPWRGVRFGRTGQIMCCCVVCFFSCFSGRYGIYHPRSTN